MYAIEKCKIPGYLGDQISTSRETHQAHENRKNDLILIMTPEKQDKTLELSKHWSVDSTPARNEVIMKKDISSKIGKVRRNQQ